MAILDYLFPMQQMDTVGGLLGEDEARKIRQQSQIAGLLNFGANLLAQSGPSPQQRSFGQMLAPSLLAGYQAAQGATESQLQRAVAAQRAQREQDFRKAIQESFVSQPTGTGLTQRQEGSQAEMLTRPEFGGGFADEETRAALMTNPNLPRERVLDQNRFMAALAEFNPLEFARMQAARQPTARESFRPMTADEKKQYGLPQDAAFQISNTGKISQIGSGPLVKNVVGGEPDPFIKKGQEEQAKAFSEIANSGRTAQRSLQDINRLESLLEKSPTGLGASAKLFAGNFGIATKGLSELQAAEALINKLVPQQRTPGSGPMSDADLELYKKSLVRIINQPGANQIIIDSTRAINNYLIEEAKIANDALNGKISRQEAQERFATLGNPVQDFFRKNANLMQGTGQSGMPSLNAIDAEIQRRQQQKR